MKQLYFKNRQFLIAIFALFFSLFSYSQIIITGTFDGPLTGGVPKGVELYVTESISDLSIYGIGSANNGGGTDGDEYSLSGTANSGDFIYIASEEDGFTSFFGFTPTFTSSAANINGDDAIELFKNGIVIDTFGDIAVDGNGEAWEYLDGWAYRNNGTGANGSIFVLSNWTFSGINTLENGSTNATTTNPFPIGSYSSTGGGVVDSEIPSAPTNLIATNISETSADLSWEASTDNIAVTAYKIYNETTLIGSSTVNSFSVTNLIAATNYTFTVIAADAAGNVSEASNEVIITTLDATEPPVSSESSLIITGVIDGPLSGGVPKAIELYAKDDILDLSVYGFGSANNGGGTDGVEFTLSGSANAGDFIYIASEETGFTEFFGFAPNFTSGAAGINGDDAVELFLNGDVIDTFGDINTDGTGTAWEYMDGWASRKDFTGPDGGSFIIENWTFSGINALDNATSNASATTAFPIAAYGPDLIITGIVDGPLSGGVPKAVELYAKYDIADLSIYGFGSATNGGGTDGVEFTLSGSANAGDFIYIASEETGFTEFFGFAPNFTSSSAGVNGDDAVELFLNGEVIDTFGDINTDGTGTAWDYMDGWAYRNDNTGPDGTNFIFENWTFSGINALDGTTTNTTFPIGTYGGGDVVEEPLELISILEARADDKIGALVKVTGVVTVSDQFAGSAYIQDATGAIAIFDVLVHGEGVFMVGDSITVTGTRSVYNEQVQISPVTTVEYNGVATNPIEPLTITLSEMVNHPAELVRIENPSFPVPGDIMFGNANYVLTDASGTGELRIDYDVEDLVGLGQPETCSEVIGVVGNYYEVSQLLPRFGTDMACAVPFEQTGDDLLIAKDKTFDVVTWNIEWFGDESNSPAAGDPDSDAIQKEAVKNVLQQLDADIYAVEEIADAILFDEMVNEMPGYSYVLSDATSYPNDTEGISQKIGFIYNTNTVEVVSTKVLLKSIHPYYNGGDDSALADYPESDKTRFYASGRLPFMLTANVTINGTTEQVNVIDLHARANSSADALGRYNMRKYDVEVLKDSLDAYYANSKIILLGDYNDDVDVTVADVSPITTSTFEAYVNDSDNYNVLTSVLSDAGKRSFVSYENMIDHITVSNELVPNYINESARVHYEFYSTTYTKTASDHFPVSTRLQLKLLTLDNSLATNVTCNGEDNGTATVEVSGGIEPYTFEWSDGQSTSAATNLKAGDYSVTITDALGGVLTSNFIITEPTALELTTTENTTVYYGYEDQSCATLAVEEIVGGVAPYTYEWSTGGITETIEVCPEESKEYTVTITDANGCSTTATINVTVIDVTCGNNNNSRFPKVEVCFRGKSMCVSTMAVNSLLAYGATLGSCDNYEETIVITNLKTYPNPVRNYVLLNFESSQTVEAAILVYNFRGQLVKQSTVEVQQGNFETRLNTRDLRRGVYYLKIVVNGQINQVKRLIKI